MTNPHHLTDYELDHRSDPNIPKWIYYVVFYGGVAAVGWLALYLAVTFVMAIIARHVLGV